MLPPLRGTRPRAGDEGPVGGLFVPVRRLLFHPAAPDHGP